MYLLLENVSTLHTPQTKAILERYQNEKRRTDAPDGPGAPVGVLVQHKLDG